MMKIYNYFLFRVYMLYKEKWGESSEQAFFSVIAVSSALVCIHLILLYLIMNYYDLLPIFYNMVYIVLFMILIGVINYFFIKRRRFLEYGFKKDKNGGILIIGYLLILSLLCVIISNKNREKIFKEREKSGAFFPEKKGEGKILIILWCLTVMLWVQQTVEIINGFSLSVISKIF